MANIVAIGALGGSGTRAVAQILIESGVYMGDDLNGPNDNLTFTRLLKNPNWYKHGSKNQIFKRLFVFEQYMKNDKLSLKSFFILSIAAMQNPTFRSGKSFYIKSVNKMMQKGTNRELWGWKEPNTQIYLKEIGDYFPDLKYIHVLRNGLDMAFSKNKQQLNNWGWKYGINLTGKETCEELAIKQLDYWIASTKDVLLKQKSFGDRFFLINYSDFCSRPEYYVDRILQFSGIQVSNNTLKRLYNIPKETSSNDRYKDYDLNIFTKKQISEVRKMGFMTE